MSRYSRRIAFAVCILLVAVFAVVRWAQSCSEGEPVFEDYSLHPDVPFETYAQGKLGIVQPSFARSYLVVAYRYFSGVPLTKDEQEGALALWLTRDVDFANIYSDRSASGITGAPPNPYTQTRQDDSEGPHDWLEARAQVVSGAAHEIQQSRGTNYYSQYLNCSNDALATAAATLKSRIAKFGKNDSGVQEWVAAQDAVFANCNGDSAQPVLPKPPAASLPAILRYDREYQTAAAYMYSNHYDEALQGFQHVTQEADSPWHNIAPYLIARSMLRRATVEAKEPVPGSRELNLDTEKMRAASDYIHKLLAESPNRPFAQPLQSLLDRAEFRLHPEAQCLRLSEQLCKPAPPGRFYDWLWDYTWLLDQRADVPLDSLNQTDDDLFLKLASDREKAPLLDWIATFQKQRPVGAEYAFRVWKAQPQSVPWLVAVLSKTDRTSQNASEILSAADRLPTSSRAYLTVFYHRMRLRNQFGNFKEVRASIDAFLHSSTELPSVARDALLNLRLDAASDLDDAVHFLPRDNCSVTRRMGMANCDLNMPDHSALYLNTLPLELLVHVGNHNDLTDEQKSQFVRNIWLRAVLLGRHDVAQPFDARVFLAPLHQSPVPQEAVAKLVHDYESASSPADKQFAAVFLMQHQYAFGYDMGSGGEWCASPVVFPETYRPPSRFAPQPPPYLTEAQRRQAETEQTALDHVDSQANYYVKVVVDYAETHPDDPRVPEALSRAVKNTRMNCLNSRTGPLSKTAFELLHKRYPDTTWAKNTKYWFGI